MGYFILSHPVQCIFYWLDAMLPHELLSVCLSVTSRCSGQTAEKIQLVFGVEASTLPTHTKVGAQCGKLAAVFCLN